MTTINLPAGICLVGYSGPTVSLSTNPVWLASLDYINEPNANRLGLQSWKPTQVFPNVTQAVKDNFYLVKVKAEGLTTSVFTLTLATAPVTNQIPVANAGADNTYPPETVSFQLQGSGVDPDGSISTYLWTRTGGPSASFSANSVAVPTVTHTGAGTYKFQLVVTDNQGTVSLADEVIVTISAPVSGGFTKPAPTGLIVDNVRNMLTFTHASGAFATQDKFRYRVNGGPLKLLTGIREANNTETTFLVGNIDAAAGAVEVCEVNTSGVQISPFASTAQAYTSGVLQAGLLLESDSIFYNAGMLADANVETIVTSQENELTRMEALLDASGIDWKYRVFAFPGRRASEINAADALNNINTLGPNYLSQVPNMIFHSGEWINERRAGTSKEQVYEINKATFLAVRAAGKYQNLVISGPTDANIEAVADGESWETCVDYWTTRLRAEWTTFADAFVDFSTCPYVGVGTNVEKGLVNGIYGDTLHQATPGKLVILSRVLAAVLALNGQLVHNDLGTPTLQIVNNTITTIHSSKSAVETSVNGGATWHITPIYDLLDQSGTARIRLVADPNTEVRLPFTIATGFEPESVAYAASARALGSYYIRPEKYNPAIALLKATDRLSDVVLLAHGGGGALYSPGTLRLARWKALIGPDLFPPLPENAPTFTETADNGRGAVDWRVGYQTHLVATLATIPAPYAVLMRVEVTAPSYSGIASLNKEKLCVITNGGLVNLSNNVVNSPKTDLPMTGYHNVVVRVNENNACLLVDGTGRVDLSTAVGPLDHLALSAILDAAGVNSLSLTGNMQSVCVVKGVWTDPELNTLASAL